MEFHDVLHIANELLQRGYQHDLAAAIVDELVADEAEAVWETRIQSDRPEPPEGWKPIGVVGVQVLWARRAVK